MNITIKNIKLIGELYEDFGLEWYQDFSVCNQVFDSLVVDLINDKYMPHINPNKLSVDENGIDMCMKTQCLNYFIWYHKEYYDDYYRAEDIPKIFENATFNQE